MSLSDKLMVRETWTKKNWPHSRRCILKSRLVTVVLFIQTASPLSDAKNVASAILNKELTGNVRSVPGCVRPTMPKGTPLSVNSQTLIRRHAEIHHRNGSPGSEICRGRERPRQGDRRTGLHVERDRRLYA